MRVSVKNKLDLKIIVILLAIYARVSSEFRDNDSQHVGTSGNNHEDYVFITHSGNLLPTLSNGHLGFTVFGGDVYMNALYNGLRGLSHRARIPNELNINISDPSITNRTYSFNAKSGLFQIDLISHKNYRIVHHIYAHRFYNRAIINQVYIYRLNYGGDITIGLNRNAGNSSKDITFDHKNIIKVNNQSVTAACGLTNEVEDPEYQVNRQRVCVLWNRVPEHLTLEKSRQAEVFKFVMDVDGVLSVAKQEMMDVFSVSNLQLLDTHVAEWDRFWKDFDIKVTGNRNLSRAIYASVFYLVSSLPSNQTNLPSNAFYGLSPTGLGRGSTKADYEGHNFWDTEIWMHPPILMMSPKWSKTLLNYRFRNIQAAKRNSFDSGFKGARFPWESAYTGLEVTQPCCPEVARNQIHVTADISFAIRNHFAATNDLQWLHREGCPLAVGIANFWKSRVIYNESTHSYDIRDVMGPDEDHDLVSNNVYTNVVAGYALYFADFASCLCNNGTNAIGNWTEIAKRIKLLYNSTGDYHPQYEGYQRGTIIKQADTVLIGYPLLYNMSDTVKRNDLLIYENVTRATGPAMTWQIHEINHIALNEIDRADVFFRKSYQNYIRPSFNVWNEVIQGEEGATNFITGSGGFLQTILNGYAGIKLFIDRLEIRSPRLPFNTDKDDTHVRALRLDVDIPLKIQYDNGSTFTIAEDLKYQINSETVVIRRQNSVFGQCKLPEDIIGMLD